MNSESLYADRDMGKDGNNVVGNCNKYFAKDAFGFSLGYHNSDYTPINASATFLADKTGSDLLASTTNLYNGNISSMVTTITTPVTFIPEPSFEILAQSNAYTYDRLNRLVESKSFANLDYENNDWMNSGNPYDGRYHNQFTYNANGGMLTALAKNAMGETIDNQTYHRATTTNGRYINNRTYAITDVATQTSGEDLLDQQAFDNTVLSNNNYDFTEIGERNKNLSEDIESITWTVYGKKAGVKRTATSGKNNVTFNYDPQNNRIAKHVYTSDDIWINSEYYVHDAQGNLMATYRLEASSGSGLSYELTERHIYGSSSIGINTTPVEMIGVTPPTGTYTHIIGDKRFNGSNHLNNVLSVFTDKKLPLDIDNNGIIDGYLPQVISANDYAPFGSRLAERTFNKELYPNSFNGKRESAELDGEQDYGERDYNPKEREFDKDDPLITQLQKYPELSPYQFASNSPIWAIDLDGLEAKYYQTGLKNRPVFKLIQSAVDNNAYGKNFNTTLKNQKTYDVYYIAFNIDNSPAGVTFNIQSKEDIEAKSKYLAKSDIEKIAKLVDEGRKIVVVGVEEAQLQQIERAKNKENRIDEAVDAAGTLNHEQDGHAKWTLKGIKKTNEEGHETLYGEKTWSSPDANKILTEKKYKGTRQYNALVEIKKFIKSKIGSESNNQTTSKARLD